MSEDLSLEEKLFAPSPVWDPIREKIRIENSQGFYSVEYLLVRLYDHRLINNVLWNNLIFTLGDDVDDGGIMLFIVSSASVTDEAIEDFRENPEIYKEKFLKFVRTKKHKKLTRKIAKNLEIMYNNYKEESHEEIQIIGYIVANLNID